MTCVIPSRPSGRPAALLADRWRWSRKMRSWFSGRHFSRCGTLGCTIRSLTPGTIAAGAPARRRWPHAAKAKKGTMPSASARPRRRRPAGPFTASARRTRGRQQPDADQGQAIDADKGGALQQRQRIGQRIAQHVPRKPAQQVPAGVFHGRERKRQRRERGRGQGASRQTPVPLPSRRRAPDRRAIR